MRNQAMGVVKRSVFAEMDEQMRMDKVESAVHQLTFIHKVFLIRDQGFGLDDGLFHGWFTEEEESLLFQLEAWGEERRFPPTFNGGNRSSDG